MPLPIAVGGVSLSSERLIPPPFGPSQNLDPHVPEPIPIQSVTWAVCPRNEWQARIVVSFFDEDNESSNNRRLLQQQQHEQKRRRLVEIRVQISPLARALSPKAYRETFHHLELFTYEDDNDNGSRDYESDSSSSSEDDDDDESFSSNSETDDDDHLGRSTHRQPQVVFSRDRRHLMVLLFHKNIQNPNHRQGRPRHNQQQSAVIVFELQKPKSTANSSSDDRRKIPLPSYIAKPPPDSSDGSSEGGEFANAQPNNSLPFASLSPTGGSPAVATRPKIVPSYKQITAICSVSGEPFFLAVQNDATLKWIDAQSARIVATAALPALDPNRCFVSSMKASPVSTLNSGMVALVIAASNSNSAWRSNSSQSSESAASYITDYDENDVDGILSGMESNSLGSDSHEHSGDPLVKGGDCVLFKWSNLSLTNNPQQLTTPDNIQNSDDKNETLEATKDEHMNQLVPQGVQKKAISSPQSHVASGKASGMMHVGFLSVWSPPSGSGENIEARVTDVCFGSLPSVLCISYTHTNRGKVSLGPRQKLAQVLALWDNTSGGSSKGCDLVPVVSLYLSPDQVEQAPSVANIGHNTNDYSDEGNDNYESHDDKSSEYETSEDESSSDEESDESRNENPLGTLVESRLVGIQHDAASDTFVVSSIFCGNRDKKDHWVGCVWNWRANAIGWMVQRETAIQPSFLRNSIGSSNDGMTWSRLYLGRDPYVGGAPYLVYIDSSLQNDGNHSDNGNSAVLKTSKRTVPAAMLSPVNTLDPIVFTERSSLLLSENCVSFPSVATNDSDATVRELDWKISSLPLLYTASQGPPRIAAMGPTRAKSIAVASARGVCVLDTYNNKWKQFGSPSEERSFSILSMTWWEGSPKGKKDDERDDLLVAVTQTRSGAQFLSCWSPKRLDLMHQLMDTPDLEWKPGESQDPEPSWGISLPENVKVTSISLLPEPETEQDRSDAYNNPRRALVLVYSPDLVTAECDFLVFQLQVFRNRVSSSHSSEPYIARRPFYVMARKAIQANMNHNTYPGPVTSAFIASGSFQFDLRTSKRKKSVLEINEGDFVATLGVTRSPGGIQAVSVFKDGETCTTVLSNFEVSKYQLSDRILSGVLSSTKRLPIIRFVWTIELLNGHVICWSVPSIVGSQPDILNSLAVDSSFTEETRINPSATKRPKGLNRLDLVCKKNALGKNERWILGTFCEVGSVSDWAVQSTFGCQFDISLGQVPHSIFGCVLRCGQNSQKVMRGQIHGIDNRIFSSNILEINSNSQSPFTITPPAFVIPLYALLLEAACIQIDLNAAELPSHVDDLKNHLQAVEKQVQHRLTSVRNTDSMMMALRLITFRSLEMMAKTHKKNEKQHSKCTELNFVLSKMLLSKVVDAARRCTTELQFASLFLEVGRQTEPSNLEHMFPLPVNHDGINVSSSIGEARSVVDLFTICIDKGSLAASASALPLLTSKAQARYYCELLLDEAINNFVENSSPSQYKFDCTEEERRVLGDFFRFGMKLEDAECGEERIRTASQEGRMSPDGTSVNTIDGSISNQSFLPETPENVQRRLICSLTANSSILNYLVPSSMRGESEQQRIEAAIRREASSFIKKSLDDPVLDFAMLPDWDDSFASPNANMADTNSVAYVIGDALIELLQTENSNNNWKVIAALAKLILQEGVEIPSSYNLFVEVADKSQPLDVLSIIPESYDVDNGLEQNMTTYIEEGISSCYKQITFADANHIIDMAMMLIYRIQLLPLTDIGDQTVFELGLVFIIMVAGDISGRSCSFQDMMEEDSLLNTCYKRATSALESTNPNDS